MARNYPHVKFDEKNITQDLIVPNSQDGFTGGWTYRFSNSIKTCLRDSKSGETFANSWTKRDAFVSIDVPLINDKETTSSVDTWSISKISSVVEQASKTIQSSYANIAARDADKANVKTGFWVYVADATADTTVKIGWAIYERTSAGWSKRLEQETMDEMSTVIRPSHVKSHEWGSSLADRIMVGSGADKTVMTVVGKEPFSLLDNWSPTGSNIGVSDAIVINKLYSDFIKTNGNKDETTVEYFLYFTKDAADATAVTNDVLEIKKGNTTVLTLATKFLTTSNVAKVVNVSNVVAEMHNTTFIVRFDLKINADKGSLDEVQLTRSGTNTLVLSQNNFGMSIKQYAGLVDTTGEPLANPYHEVVVLVDDVTLERKNDKLQVKDGGITIKQLAAGITDNVTLERNNDKYQVKDGGITIKQLAAGITDNVTLERNNDKYQIKDGGISLIKLDSGIKTSLKLADNGLLIVDDVVSTTRFSTLAAVVASINSDANIAVGEVRYYGVDASSGVYQLNKTSSGTNYTKIIDYSNGLELRTRIGNKQVVWDGSAWKNTLTSTKQIATGDDYNKYNTYAYKPTGKQLGFKIALVDGSSFTASDWDNKTKFASIAGDGAGAGDGEASKDFKITGDGSTKTFQFTSPKDPLSVMIIEDSTKDVVLTDLEIDGKGIEIGFANAPSNGATFTVRVALGGNGSSGGLTPDGVTLDTNISGKVEIKPKGVGAAQLADAVSVKLRNPDDITIGTTADNKLEVKEKGITKSKLSDTLQIELQRAINAVKPSHDNRHVWGLSASDDIMITGRGTSLMKVTGEEEYSLLKNWQPVGNTIATTNEFVIDKLNTNYLGSVGGKHPTTLEYLFYFKASEVDKVTASGSTITISKGSTAVITLRALYKPYSRLGTNIDVVNVVGELHGMTYIVRFNLKINDDKALYDEIQLLRTGTNTLVLAQDNFGMSIKQYKGLVDTTNVPLPNAHPNFGVFVDNVTIDKDAVYKLKVKDKGIGTTQLSDTVPFTHFTGIDTLAVWYQNELIQQKDIVTYAASPSESLFLTGGGDNQLPLTLADLLAKLKKVDGSKKILLKNGDNFVDIDSAVIGAKDSVITVDTKNAANAGNLYAGSEGVSPFEIGTKSIADAAVTKAKTSFGMLFTTTSSWDGTAPAGVKDLKAGDLMRWRSTVYMLNRDAPNRSPDELVSGDFANYYTRLLFTPTTYTTSRTMGVGEVFQYNGKWYEVVNETINNPPTAANTEGGSGTIKYKFYREPWGSPAVVSGQKLIGLDGAVYSDNALGIISKSGDDYYSGATKTDLKETKDLAVGDKVVKYTKYRYSGEFKEALGDFNSFKVSDWGDGAKFAQKSLAKASEAEVAVGTNDDKYITSRSNYLNVARTNHVVYKVQEIDISTYADASALGSAYKSKLNNGNNIAIAADALSGVYEIHKISGINIRVTKLATYSSGLAVFDEKRKSLQERDAANTHWIVALETDNYKHQTLPDHYNYRRDVIEHDSSGAAVKAWVDIGNNHHTHQKTYTNDQSAFPANSSIQLSSLHDGYVTGRTNGAKKLTIEVIMYLYNTSVSNVVATGSNVGFTFGGTTYSLLVEGDNDGSGFNAINVKDLTYLQLDDMMVIRFVSEVSDYDTTKNYKYHIKNVSTSGMAKKKIGFSFMQFKGVGVTPAPSKIPMSYEKFVQFGDKATTAQIASGTDIDRYISPKPFKDWWETQRPLFVKGFNLKDDSWKFQVGASGTAGQSDGGLLVSNGSNERTVKVTFPRVGLYEIRVIDRYNTANNTGRWKLRNGSGGDIGRAEVGLDFGDQSYFERVIPNTSNSWQTIEFVWEVDVQAANADFLLELTVGGGTGLDGSSSGGTRYGRIQVSTK